jgi:hypothetical protein
MSAVIAPSATDRSDLRTVLTGGTRVGLGIAAAVVLYLLSAKDLPAGGGVRAGVETLLVLAAGTAAAFLPGTWCVARNVEGIAGAAATGLWGTIVFSVVDIALLRPLQVYPWTWDAVGGGTTWWYLPMWWILGTFLAWMGGTRIALRAARRSDAGVMRSAGPVLIGAIVVAALARVTGVAMLPVAAGAGFALTLLALVLVALARRA